MAGKHALTVAVVALFVLLTGLSLNASVDSAVVGGVAASENATLGGQSVLGGQTVFSGDSLKVGDGAAFVDLNGGSRVELAQDTEVSFERESNQVTAVLVRGTVVIYHPVSGGMLLRVKTGNLTIVPANEFSTVGEVAMTEQALVVAAPKGLLLVERSGQTLDVPQGRAMRFLAETVQLPQEGKTGGNVRIWTAATTVGAKPSAGLAGETLSHAQPAQATAAAGATEAPQPMYRAQLKARAVFSDPAPDASPYNWTPLEVTLPLAGGGLFSLTPFHWEEVIPYGNYYGPTGTPTNPAGSSGVDPVNTASGAYYTSSSDLEATGRGSAFNFTRSYNSPDGYSGPLGAGWTHSYNTFLTKDALKGIVTIKQGDGAYVSFAWAGGGAYTPSTPGLFDTLQQNGDGSFTFIGKDQTRLNFSPGGKLASIVDRNGNTQALAYDNAGNLSAVTDSSGRIFKFSYDSNKRLNSITDPIGRVVEYSYDAAGNLISYRDALGGVWRYACDAAHRITTITDPGGGLYVQNTYDSQGRVVRQTSGRGFAATFAYETPSRRRVSLFQKLFQHASAEVAATTTITDPLGHVTKHLYDKRYRLIAVVDALGGRTSFTYNESNNRTSVTDAKGETTSFAYDSRGNLTQITDALENTMTFAYDDKNNLTSSVDATRSGTTLSHDAKGNLTGVRDALGNTTSLAYDGSGQLVSNTDAKGNTTKLAYDSFGNLESVTNAAGGTTRLKHDGIGRLVSVTDAQGHTRSTAYDALSRLAEIKDPLGNVTHVAYDAYGSPVRITDANGNSTDYAYDSTGDLASVTDALGNATSYAYDANGKLLKFTDAKGNTTSLEYDALGRQIRKTDPLSFSTVYSRDPVGNVASVTDPNGRTTRFTYDALNRLTTITYADGSSVSYSYGAAGYPATMVDAHGTTSYNHDALHRLTSVRQPDGKVLEYAYDATANRQSLRYSDGKAVQYSYDQLNRLVAVADWLNRKTTYSYDAVNNLLAVAYPNGAGMSFEYDAANRLTRVQNLYAGSDASPARSFTYTLDHVGNRAAVRDGSGRETRYSYDPIDQLTSISDDHGVTRFAYDPAGNRAKQIGPEGAIDYTYDAGNRLLRAGAATFTYDQNGNQLSRTEGGATIAYAYDPANRLLRVTGPGVKSHFVYGGDGNRISQSTAAGIYNYLNDVGTILPVVLEESGPDGGTAYTYGNLHGPISRSGPAGDFFYQYDGLGSVVGLTDSTGHLQRTYAYDAWGQGVGGGPGQIATGNELNFTGEALDPGTGLYYLRGRYYDPTIGRFVSHDPIGGAGGLNLYRYVGNSPINHSDPSGTQYCTVWICPIFTVPGGNPWLLSDEQTAENMYQQCLINQLLAQRAAHPPQPPPPPTPHKAAPAPPAAPRMYGISADWGALPSYFGLRFPTPPTWP